MAAERSPSLRSIPIQFRHRPDSSSKRQQNIAQHLHERLRRIGWSKSATLAKHALAPNFEDLLLLAEQLTAYELKAFLKEGPARLG
jgi:hypothetical protein